MSGLFSQAFLQKQKDKLLKSKMDLLGKIKSTEEIQITAEDTREEGDLAQAIIGQAVTFELKERELSKLRDINEALYKIDNGLYGICEETDEPIERVRLEKVPWARLSIAAAEEKERAAPFRS